MSFFLDVLRSIFGGKNDKDVQEATSTNRKINSQSNLSDTQTGYGSCRSFYSSNGQYDPQFTPTSVTRVHTSRGIGNTNNKSPSFVSQCKASNPLITKPSEQGLKRNSSQPSSSSTKPSSSLSKPSAYSSKQSPSLSGSGLHQSLPEPTLTSSSISSETISSSLKPPPPSTKTSISLASPNPNNQQTKSNFFWEEKGASQSTSLGTPSMKPPPPSTRPTLSLDSSNLNNQQTMSNYFWEEKGASLLTSSETPSSPWKPPPPSTKPTLSPASSNPNNQQTKTNSFWVEKGASSSTSSETPSSSLKPPPLSTKPTLSPVSPNQNNQQTKTNYFWEEKGASLLTSSGTPSSPLKPPPPSTKPTLSPASPNPNNQQTKTNSFWVEKGASPSTSSETPSSSLKPPPLSTKPTLSPALPNQNNQQTKANYIWVEKGASPSTYSGTPSSPLKPPPLSTKPTLSLASPNQNNQQTNYIWVEKGASRIDVIPEDIKCLIEDDIVPGILEKPLSASTYKDYFNALLYAEDYYFEKWDGFEMENVTLKLDKASIYTKKGNHNDLNKFDEKDDKVFIAFEIDSIPERRPFLLSRDFASVRPSGSKVKPFQGIIYRVVKSNRVLVEFEEDFHSQHDSACKYDVSFSFNRVCLKRAYQAIAAASDPLFQNFLFPTVPRKSSYAVQVLPINHMLDREQLSAVQQILSFDATPPYLVEGSLFVAGSEQLSRTGMVVQEAVIQIYRTFPSCRILICAPINRTCDVLMRGLKKEIPESNMFRANAAFRELDGVPYDILPSCLYKGECFSCPSLQELRKFKVILSTFMSSFRLHNEGIVAGHFSHIFLVDASFATEPETMVALANLANEKTAVVITGAQGNHSRWIRSNIARKNGGLRTSYFERLCGSMPYKSLDPKLITRL
ncbi:uncharacterized protein LOC132276093 [Cornus florida]|uniref:uncharacterized protein LOC132276093 n=1 Tax=Cornus florida TaxID=4283 RepID=UPI002899B77C|nr:uncharacterized protein LOC132276093 [Cornus florida]